MSTGSSIWATELIFLLLQIGWWVNFVIFFLSRQQAVAADAVLNNSESVDPNLRTAAITPTDFQTLLVKLVHSRLKDKCMHLNQAYDRDAFWVQCMHLKLGLDRICCQVINAWPGPYTGRPIPINADLCSLIHLTLASNFLIFNVCSAFCVTQCLYISNVIYLSTETNEIVLFNLLTCLTEEICQNEMFTFFLSFHL